MIRRVERVCWKPLSGGCLARPGWAAPRLGDGPTTAAPLAACPPTLVTGPSPTFSTPSSTRSRARRRCPLLQPVRLACQVRKIIVWLVNSYNFRQASAFFFGWLSVRTTDPEFSDQIRPLNKCTKCERKKKLTKYFRYCCRCLSHTVCSVFIFALSWVFFRIYFLSKFPEWGDFNLAYLFSSFFLLREMNFYLPL